MLPQPVGWFSADDDPAEDFERQKRFTPYTAMYNMTGQPAISLPLYQSGTGCRSGSCWSAGRAARRRCSRWRAQLEAALPWPTGIRDLAHSLPHLDRARRIRYLLAHDNRCETVLVFVGIPLAIILLLAFAVFGRSTLQQPNRYRPGRPWNYAPVWFVAASRRAAEPRGARLAIEGTSRARRTQRRSEVPAVSGERRRCAAKPRCSTGRPAVNGRTARSPRAS